MLFFTKVINVTLLQKSTTNEMNFDIRRSAPLVAHIEFDEQPVVVISTKVIGSRYA